MSTETWLQSLIKLYTAARKPQPAPARPAAQQAMNFARPVYGPAPKPVYGPPTQAQAQTALPPPPVYRVTPPAFPLPRFEADPASRAPAPVPRPGFTYTQKPAALQKLAARQWTPDVFLPMPPGWGQPTEAAKAAYKPIAEKWQAEREVQRERIFGQPFDAGRPELAQPSEQLKRIVSVMPNGANLVTAMVQAPQRLAQAERLPIVGDIFRNLHYGALAAGSYLGQAGQALAGTALGTLEGEATRDPAFRQQLAKEPIARLLSPAARQEAMAPFLGLTALAAMKMGHEEVLPVLAGLQDPIVATTTSPQNSLEQALPTYLNRYSGAEQFVAEMAAGWPLDPLAVFGMGAKASQAARMRRFMSVYLPGMQSMVGDLDLLDRFTMATAKGINEGKVPLLGWVMRETPKTNVYLAAQDALTYGGWLSQMLPPEPTADDVVRVFSGFLANPDAVTGGAAAARKLAGTLDGLDVGSLPAVQEAIEKGGPVNMPKLVGELADTTFMREAAANKMLTPGKKPGEIVFNEPADQRFVRWLKDIESAFLLGTPRYAIKNFANNVFTAGFDGYGVGRSMDDARRLAAEVPISHQGLYQDVMGPQVKGANTFAEHLQGKGWGVSQKLPWSRAVRKVTTESRIGEPQARLRVFGDAVGKLKDDLYIGGRDLGRGARGLRPIAPPDIAGPHAGLVNQVLARDWNVATARQEVQSVLNGGTRPPLDVLLPQRLYLQPDMLTALNTAWKNARSKDDFMRVLDRADNLMRQQISDAAASGVHADMTQIGDAIAPVAEQMAATIIPNVPGTREIAEQVAQAEVGRTNAVLQGVAKAVGEVAGDPASTERAANGVLAIMNRLQYQWTSDYIEANRLLNRYNGARQNIFDRGLQGEDKARALETAWNNYRTAIGEHWTRHHEQADRLTQTLLGQFNDLVAGKIPAGSFDQRVAERAITHLQRNTPELFADDIFKAKVDGNRKTLNFERQAVVQRVMGYVARTGDTTPVGWLADAVKEERRLTDAAVGEITGMRSTLRKDPNWPDFASKAWDALNTDQRSVWRAFLAAMDDADKGGQLAPPRFNQYTELLRLSEANDRVNALNKLAKGAGIATATEKGIPQPQHLANFLNKAFREAGLGDEVMFVAPKTGSLTDAWHVWVSDLNEQELAVALRALKGTEALTPLERMIGKTPSVAAKQYIRQYADWLQGDQTLAPPTRGKLTEAQAKAWRQKIDDLLGAPEAPAPVVAPAPSIAAQTPTTVGVSPEAPPTIAPALQAARDSNVAIAEQLGVKDEILARSAEGQDAGQIARDLRAEGALPESYDFQPGEMAAQVEPVTMTDRAVVNSVIQAEPPAVAQAASKLDDVAVMAMTDIERQYPTMAAGMKTAAQDMIDALQGGTPGRRQFIDAGAAGTEVRGLPSTYPAWYGKLIAEQGVSKDTVLNALKKIRDGKYDKGKTVERLKKVIIEQIADGYEGPGYKLQPDVEAWGVMGRAAADLQTPEAQVARQAEAAGYDFRTIEGDDNWFYIQKGGGDEDYFTGPLDRIKQYLDQLTRPGIAAPGTAETQSLIARLLGNPRPSATHVAATEAEGQLWELGQLREAADRMWNTNVMPASREVRQATMRWFDQVAVPQIAAAKTVIGNAAQAITDEILLDYGRTRNFDRILDLGFPYHYWTTRSGWNWTKRAMHHPFTIGTYVKARHDRMEERKSDNGLRPRFWNSLKLKYPWLPDYFEDALYFNPDQMIMPFGDLRLPDWDDANQANSAWYKALQGVGGVGLAPHVPWQAMIMNAEGMGWGGVRDYIPQWDAAAAMLPPSKWTFGPGPGGSRWDVYRLQRMMASMAADAMKLPNVDYNNPEEVLAASQKAGAADLTALLPYVAAQKMIEAWADGQLTTEQVDALFQDPLVAEAMKRTAKERQWPVLTSLLAGLSMKPVATGETTQVATQNAKYAMSYGGEVAGEQGTRANAQAISAANPFERGRWGVYGSLPGEQETTAESVYWMTYGDAGMQDIEQRFDDLEEALIQQNPGNHELFQAYQTERFAAIDGLEQTIPKDEQKPYLWSIVGASPTEAAQIRQNQIVYRLYKTRPKPNDYLLANGKPDWDKWNKAVETWNQDLLTTAKADPLITEALAHFSPEEREKVLTSLATADNMAAYGRGFDDPLTALHKTVWDIYYQPVRDYMAAAETKYGTDIFDRQAAYRAELIQRFGENIYDVQDGYFKLKQGSAARRNYLKANPQLKAYWDNKDAIARKHRVLAFLENKDKLWAKIPQTFKGGQARDFIDEVLAAYPEKKWTRQELLAVYNTVKPFPDRYYLQALNDFEEERLQAFYKAAGVSPNRAREGAWTPEEVKAAVFAGKALPLDTIPEQLGEGQGTPATPEIQQEANDILAAEERAKASGGKGKSSGGRSSGRRYYSRRYYSHRRGGGGGGGSAPTYRPYLPGYTPGSTKERRRVYIR